MGKGTKKRGRVISEVPVNPKPTMRFNASQYKGKDLEVGRKTSVVVKGTVVEETIERYEPGRKKSYTVEVDSVKPSKNPCRISPKPRKR